MLIQVIILITGLFLLIKGADLLVEGASALARRLRISDLVVGLTVVAFGTSTPELFVNIASVLKGSTGLAIGNILGSNIANILLILGISALIFPLTVGKGTVWKEIPFSLAAAVLLALLANDFFMSSSASLTIGQMDGVILLACFAGFVVYLLRIAKPVPGMKEYVSLSDLTLSRCLGYVGLGLAGLALGSQLIVRCAMFFASALGMSETVIGLTLVAVGTSLPELVTSAVAAWKRNAEIAVGNVVGSNIFNILLVLGCSATFRPLPFDPVNNFDTGVVVGASLVLFIFMFTGKRHRVDRWEGALFLAGYLAYLAFVVG